MPENKRIGFIGGGNMAGAIIDAILTSHIVAPDRLAVFDTSADKRDFFCEKGLRIAASNQELVESSDLIFLAVKPQVISLVLEEIQGMTAGKCVISIAAGVTVSRLREALGGETHIVRVLPNTPMLVLKGATVVAKPDDVPQGDFDLILAIFRAAGEVELLEEEHINQVIPVSSSSPAFFFRMIRAMARAGENCGIAYPTALKLAVATMHGAAHMMMESGKTPDELITQVSSPGGTTIAALTAFDEFDYEGLIEQAFERCIRRADELGEK